MTPLVLVHGFMGGGDQWGFQNTLGEKRALICVDLPGFGRNADMTPINSITGFAQWLLADLTSRGIKTFDLLGHSMGGMVVQEVIRLAPERVGKLVLYGTGAIGVLPGRFETIETSMARAREDGPKSTARRIAATWFKDGVQHPEYEPCAQIAEQSTLPAILAGLEAMKNWAGLDALADIESQTLVIWGDQDRTYPRTQAETLQARISNSMLQIVPNCAHVIHLENPDEFNRALDAFLQMSPAKSTP